MKCDEPWLPGEAQIAYIASWSGVGAICGYLLWASANWLWPDLELNVGNWMQIGASLGGGVAFVWVLVAAQLV